MMRLLFFIFDGLLVFGVITTAIWQHTKGQADDSKRRRYKATVSDRNYRVDAASFQRRNGEK